MIITFLKNILTINYHNYSVISQRSMVRKSSGTMGNNYLDKQCIMTQHMQESMNTKTKMIMDNDRNLFL